MKRIAGLHPFLFAAFPVVSLWATNLGEFDETQAIRPLLAGLAGIALLIGLLRLVLRDWARTRLLATIAVLVFSTYGHFYELLKSAAVGGVIVGRHRFLVPLAIGLLGMGAWWVSRRMADPRLAEKVFGIAGIVALLSPVSSVVVHHLSAARIERGAGPAGAGPAGSATGERHPDIYYLILDGYGRGDVLEDLYGYDNSRFLEYLERVGFFVADESRSNYMRTLTSIASSLNMDYIQDAIEQVGPAAVINQLLAEMVEWSEVRLTLEGMGYQMVAFENAWPPTQVENAESFLGPDAEHVAAALPLWALNEFELLLLRSTLLRPGLDFMQARLQPEENPLEWPYIRHRDRILFTLSAMVDVASWEGDYFVFAHLVVPHPPFVFGVNGEPVPHSEEFTFDDGDEFSGSLEEYIEGYTNQLTYLNRLLGETVDGLMAASDPDPIIILQADHGPKGYLVWDDPGQTDMREAFGILNAYYFPDEAIDQLYPSVSPVNSFRILFNTLFGAEYELLPDESYFSGLIPAYEFERMTDRARGDG